MTKPTWFSSSNNETSSLSGQIRTNTVDNVTAGTVSIDIMTAVLYSCIFQTRMKNKPTTKIKITFRGQSLEQTSAYMNAVADSNWSNNISSDPSTYYDNILTTINDLYCHFFPLCAKFITTKRMPKPWNTSSILSIIKQKTNAFSALSKRINNDARK